MSNASATLLMQAYGPEEALRTCLLALLSLSKQHTPADCPRVVVYTDKPEWFEQWHCPLPLRFRVMDAGTIKAWRGDIDFVHRVKIEVLRDFAKEYSGAVLYTDTDVLFLQSLSPLLARISAGELFMHVSEGALADDGSPMIAKLRRFLSKTALPADVSPTPPGAMMWNAGVLGFHTDYKDLLDEVLHFTDRIYPLFPKHIVEQFAFSLAFTGRGQVHNVFDYIFHYWIIKEHRGIVASFFAYFRGRPWEELVRLSALIQIPELIQQKTSFFINRSVAGKVRQLKWVPPVPDWDEMERQM